MSDDEPLYVAAIGTDKEGNEITLIDILGTESDDVAKLILTK